MIRVIKDEYYFESGIFNVNIPLRKCNGDIIFSEFLVNYKSQVTFYIFYTKSVISKEKQLKVKRGIAKIIKTNKRSREISYIMVYLSTLQQYLFNEFHIGSVSHSHFYIKPCPGFYSDNNSCNNIGKSQRKLFTRNDAFS